MTALAQLIPVTHKAPNVCAYCKARKQSCDRTVPRCRRCALKGLSCDYTPPPSPPVTGSESHISRSGSCEPRLSSSGAHVLLQMVAASLHTTNDQAVGTPLPDYVASIFAMAEINFATKIEYYGTSIRHWCPAVFEGVHKQGVDMTIAQYPLLTLGVWLVTKRACGDAKCCLKCQLYQTLKQVSALLQTRSNVDMEALQLGLSIAVYEVGHGMGVQAYQSVSSCKAMLSMLQNNTSQNTSAGVSEHLTWLKTSLIILDRVLCIALPLFPIPLAIPVGDPMCIDVSSKYSLRTPIASPVDGPPAAPEKIHLRSVVAVASGHALTYANARKRNSAPAEDYESVDDHMSGCIRMLIENPQPATWLHCDAIALGFCSHILLQQAQAEHITQLPEVTKRSVQQEKPIMALRYSRRMAWDMVKVALGRVESKEEVARLPFVALFCVLRAGVAVLETFVFSEENLCTEEEVKKLRNVVQWFGERWRVGRQFEATFVRLLNDLL